MLIPPDVRAGSDELMHRADQAMYRAKQAGRNAVEISLPDEPRHHISAVYEERQDGMDLALLRRNAIALMRKAIAMLDEMGENHAALHLQAAIDAADRVPPLKSGDELPDENIDPSVISRRPADQR